jgi:hypothetical protein
VNTQDQAALISHGSLGSLIFNNNLWPISVRGC